MWTSRATLLLLLSLPAIAGPFGRRPKPAAEEAVVTPESPPTPETPPPVTDLWKGGPPYPLGPLPEGLPNASAQGCGGCHFEAHDSWLGSGHARGWSSEAFREAVADVGTPACQSCHLPLTEQWPALVTYVEDNVNTPVFHENPEFDATLHSEGVTCVACHVRDGQVIGTRPGVQAPHPTAWTEELDSQSCAACHQMTWPGAEAPFYDTVGEWLRSPHREAGIGCVDCHMRPGAGEVGTVDHRFASETYRALSVLIDVDTLDLKRGGEALDVLLTLQNTGAGHAVPTGSPFRSLRLTSVLVGPPDKSERPREVAPVSADLARVVEPAAPYRVLRDDRLMPGEQKEYRHTHALPLGAPSGDWGLVVRLSEVVRGKTAASPVWERRIPLQVD